MQIRAESPRLQPYLHDQVVCVSAPALAVSGRDGQVTGGAHGFYRGDLRVLSLLSVTVDGVDPEPLTGHAAGGRGRFVSVVRPPGEPPRGAAVQGAVHVGDPVVVLERRRDVTQAAAGTAGTERLTVRNHGRAPLPLAVRVRLGCDLADMAEVKAGGAGEPLEPVATPAGLLFAGAGRGVRVGVTAVPAPERVEGGVLGWDVDLAPDRTFTVTLTVEVDAAEGTLPVAAAARTSRAWEVPELLCGDVRLTGLLHHGLDDLDALTLADPADRRDAFLAAGCPWYLTLFGRDSIWAARMLLPLGTDLAAGTLRALARRQGTRVDADTDEAPGKIMHELRWEGGVLPPLSYGTVDATPLFVCLLADAWRWGMPATQVEALLPAARRALDWMRESAGSSPDGFLRYHRVRPGGLSNQGWKDSGDAVQFADGRLADPPVALCEVQGYAYEAAVRGADLLDAFGSGGGAGGGGGGDGPALREWAAALRERFHRAFWVADADGPYVAIALDRDGRPVDGLASNMGHLPATGILDAEGVAAVAARLGAPDLDSGFGLRTLGARSPRFNPLGYHVGSVWTHDTAIAVAGLTATGHGGTAASLLEGILRAAPHFGYRMPELHGGQRYAPGDVPLPYPAACRPQAWSAASAVSFLTALLGLGPDVPAGTVTLAPARPCPVGVFEVRGLRVGGGRLSVRVGPDGTATVLEAPPGLRVAVR